MEMNKDTFSRIKEDALTETLCIRFFLFLAITRAGFSFIQGSNVEEQHIHKHKQGTITVHYTKQNAEAHNHGSFVSFKRDQ